MLKKMKVKKESKQKNLKYSFLRNISNCEVKYMEPMKNYTSLRIGGPADAFIVSKDLPALCNIRRNLKEFQIPFFPVGGGTNILVRDGGIEGAVISLKSFRRIELISRDEKYVRLHVEAGTPLQRLVNFSKEQGYSGIEGLAGIPGTIGGAIFGNAGAFGYEIKDVLISVEIIDSDGDLKKVEVEKIDFGYRSSNIPPSCLISGAEIKLRIDTKDRVANRVEEFLKIKREKQPIWEPSAGCVFKNPAGLSAGKLIEEAGCKGMRIGDIEVSNIHANFFINRGNGRATDFIRLMELVIQKVKEMFNVTLETEIKIVGRDVIN